jgi:hypothetical protein
VLALAASAALMYFGKVSKRIDTAYEYPVLPGSDEWVSLGTTDARVAACQIPEDALKNMTTGALAETVIGYPFIINISAYNSREEGLAAFVKEFNGVRELMTRADAESVLTKKLELLEDDEAYQKERDELMTLSDEEIDERNSAAKDTPGGAFPLVVRHGRLSMLRYEIIGVEHT